MTVGSEAKKKNMKILIKFHSKLQVSNPNPYALSLL